jgi:hypothetical protein
MTLTWKWRVAIPSYARAEGLGKWTLATLSRGGVPPGLIDVFVADEEQHKLYARTLPPDTYSRIVIARPGIIGARNFISEFYPEGFHVVSVDDDLRAVRAAVGGKLVELEGLPQFFDDAFAACKAANAGLWGVYPVCNAFYMKGTPVTMDLRPCIGPLHGMVNHRELALQCEGGKEDIERTLLYYEKYGSVVRFNHVTADQPPHAPGGLQATNLRTIELAEKGVQYLMKRWPQWVQRRPARKRGHPEVALKAKR